jgi:hypothetical protein
LAAYQSVLNPQSGSLGNAGSAGNAGNGGERWEVRGERWEVRGVYPLPALSAFPVFVLQSDPELWNKARSIK